MFTDFNLEGQFFAAMDGGGKHPFQFNEGISFNIACKDQAEIDYFWDALTKNGGEESVCSWCKDKYGVSWQINPANIDELMLKPKAWEKLMTMKKVNLKDLEA